MSFVIGHIMWSLRSSDKLFRYGDFILKKILWGPRRPKIRDFGYHGPWPTIFWGPYIFGPPDPLYMARNAKMCYFEHFFGVRWKKPPQCRGPLWKILHWKFVSTLFMAFYICWDYVYSFSQHFPMRKFSPSPSTSPSPESGGLFEIWLRNGNNFF